MSDRLAVLLQHVLPKQGLTRLAGRVARARGGGMTTRLIRWFVARYGVDMREAAEPDIAAYASFNDFFTRPLKPGARPLAAADFVCPVDGAISQIGRIDDHRIVQAKGHSFTTTDLVGGDAALAAGFRHGSFANLYLSPRDYHRLHMPCAGRLVRMIHVPGALFSVNPTTARGVPDLFARNERVVCVFDSAEHGRFVLVLVGATIVGSIATVWHGVVNATRPGTVREWRYDDQKIVLEQGAEMGRFLLGSTIVMLFEPGRIAFGDSWGPERAVRLGERMGRRAGGIGRAGMSDAPKPWDAALVRTWLERRIAAARLDQAAADRRGYDARDDYDIAAAEEWACAALQGDWAAEQAGFAARVKALIGADEYRASGVHDDARFERHVRGHLRRIANMTKANEGFEKVLRYR